MRPEVDFHPGNGIYQRNLPGLISKIKRSEKRKRIIKAAGMTIFRTVLPPASSAAEKRKPPMSIATITPVATRAPSVNGSYRGSSYRIFLRGTRCIPGKGRERRENQPKHQYRQGTIAKERGSIHCSALLHMKYIEFVVDLKPGGSRTSCPSGQIEITGITSVSMANSPRL